MHDSDERSTARARRGECPAATATFSDSTGAAIGRATRRVGALARRRRQSAALVSRRRVPGAPGAFATVNGSPAASAPQTSSDRVATERVEVVPGTSGVRDDESERPSRYGRLWRSIGQRFPARRRSPCPQRGRGADDRADVSGVLNRVEDEQRQRRDARRHRRANVRESPRSRGRLAAIRSPLPTQSRFAGSARESRDRVRAKLRSGAPRSARGFGELRRRRGRRESRAGSEQAPRRHALPRRRRVPSRSRAFRRRRSRAKVSSFNALRMIVAGMALAMRAHRSH